MPKVSIPLSSSVDTAGWPDKVNDINQPLFWKNDTVFSNDGIGSLNVTKYDGTGIITRDLSVLSVEGSKLLLDGQVIVDYAPAEFITYPQDLKCDAALLEPGRLYTAVINGNLATIKGYDVSSKGELTQTDNLTATVYSMTSRLKARLVRDNQNIIRVVQISASGFAVDQLLFTFSIASTSRLIPTPDGWDVVEPGIRVRRLNISGGTFDTIPNCVDAAIVRHTACYTLMGDPVNCRIERAPDSRDYVYVPWVKPTGTGTPRIYSQTFHPLIPFTILTDGEKYWWPYEAGYSWLETYTDGADTPTFGPTTDWSRATDGSSSQLTSQFNRTFNRVSKFSEVYQSGSFLALSYSGILIAPPGRDDYQVESDGHSTWAVIHDDTALYLVTISPDVPIHIIQMGRTLWKINVLSPYNLFDDQTRKTYVGSLDWNNRVKPEQVIRLFNQTIDDLPATIAVYNSAYGANYEADNSRSTSILAGSYHVSQKTAGSNKMLAPLETRWEEVNQDIISLIDFYYTKGGTYADYQTTGFIYNKPELVGLVYPEQNLSSILVPAPVNASYRPNLLGIGYVQWGAWFNVGLQSDLKQMDSYTLTGAVDQLGDIFAISGSVYLYDGNIIWGISFNDNQFAGRQYVVDTGGMRFIGNDSVQAFFYSSDGYLWSFTGSYQLSVILGLTRPAQSQKLNLASYCQETDELTLVFDSDCFRYRKGMMTTLPVIPANISATKKGNAFLIIENDTPSWALYEPIADPDVDTEVSDLNTDTGYIGFAEGDEVAFTRVWGKLEKEASFSVQTFTLTDRANPTEPRVFSSVKEFVVVPKQVNGRALRLQIIGDMKLKALEVEYNVIGKAPSLQGGRGK